MNRIVKWTVGFLAAPIVLAIVVSALSHRDGLVTDLPPPTGKETYGQVMPASIGGEPAVIRPLQIGESLHGARAEYGTGATIEIIQATALADLDGFVDRELKPRLDAYESRVSGKFDGVWSVRGQGRTGRLYGWQNRQWLFVIEARTQALFDEVVDRFAFIERG